MSDVTTEELERLVETRRTCGHDFLTDGCDDCANWRSIMRGWSVLRDTVSYESLAAEVLAGRKAQTQAREALEDDAYQTDEAETVMDALCMLEIQVAKALAAMPAERSE